MDDDRWVTAGIIVLAVMVSRVPFVGGQVLIITLVLLLLVNLWVARRELAPVRVRSAAPERYVTPLAVSWLLVAILPAHSFIHRSGSEATTQVGIEPLIEFGYFTFIGCMSIAIIRTLEPTLQKAKPPWAYFCIPILVFASSFWSYTFFYSFFRGLQYLEVGLLVWATVAVGRVDFSCIKKIGSVLVRWFAWTTMILIALGRLLGPIYVPTGGKNLGRFTWIGAHPNGSGLIMSITLIILVACPPHVLKMTKAIRLGFIVLTLIHLYLNHSRNSTACFIVGLLWVFGVQGQLQKTLRWVGTPIILAIGVLAGTIWWDKVVEYALRGSDSGSLASGNGRLSLIGTALSKMPTLFDILLGKGYGTTRSIFLPEHSWALNAHNSFLAHFVNLGLVGLGVYFFLLYKVASSIIRCRLAAFAEFGTALTGVVIVVMLNSVASDIMAEPVLGYVFVMFAGTIAFCVLERGGWEDQPHNFVNDLGGADDALAPRRLPVDSEGDP